MSRILKLAVGLVAGIVLLSLVHGQAVHADQYSETGAWQKLLGQVKTFKARSVLTPQGHGAPANSSVTSDFVWTGSRYRVDSTYKNFGGEAFSNVNLSFDGKVYYELQVSDKASLRRSHVRQHPSPYNLANPYTIAFEFAFINEQNKFMEVLQDPTTWKKLSQRISKREHLAVNKVAGTVLTINSSTEPDSTNRFEVFVDDKTGLPLSWKKFLNQTNFLEQEMHIVWTHKALEGTGSIMVPTSLVFSIYAQEGDKLLTGGYQLSVDPASISVNTPVIDQGFSIPATQVDELLDDFDSKK